MIVRLLVSPDLQMRVGEINKVLAEEEFKSPHPDLLYFDSDSKLGIAQARVIKEHFSLKPFQAKGRVVVIEDASSLTTDAQNALLKTLEEPPINAILLLGVDKSDVLLPTVLSRCQIYTLESKKSENKELADFGRDIERLSNLAFEKRFEYIDKLEEKEQFLEALIRYSHHKLQKDPKYLDFSKRLITAQRWQKANVNIRAILEYLMLNMPKS